EEEEEERPPWYAQQDDEEPDEPDQPPPPSGPSERYDAIRVALAGGTLFRWMHTIASVYAVQRGMSPAMPSSELLDEDRRYQSGGIGHFEPGILFELYPGAIPDPQVFPYLGLVFSFTHSAFVQTSGNPPRASPGDPIPIPTDQLELYVGLRGRYRFGQARRDPEVFLDLGYGLFEFLLGTDALQLIERSTIIPTYSTSYVQIGGGARYGIIPTYLTVGVDLAARIGTTIGADTRNIWGVETGAPFGFAFGVEARSEIPEIVRGFFVALRLSYFMFTTTYRGQVGCAEPGGCGGMINPWEDTRLWEIWPVDPSTPTQLDNVVGGVRDAVNDNYFRIQLQVGWQYW
ncbi:MAG: hypothetical protein K8H88_01220, partial [Sandaracinaceae bacterium]|nr:hypothetical protein [Sandaracinaceae bacterium]